MTDETRRLDLNGEVGSFFPCNIEVGNEALKTDSDKTLIKAVIKVAY